jgi:hypothetical protein
MVVLAAAVILGLWWTGVLSIGTASGDSYQAVFLTNDQVYFGKLSRRDSQYPVLRDVYYLQVSQTLQPRGENAPQSNLNLVKLGGEIHGPSDEMFLNRDQILFYENMKSDSQVTTAIKNYKTAQSK